MNNTHTTAGILAVAAAMAAGVLAPGEASAQIRVDGLAGVQHLNVLAPGGPSMVGTLRGELTLSLFPWVEIGGYGEILSDLGGGTTGSDFGGLVAVRPHIPFSSIDPLVFASVGYLKYPVADSTVTSGWEGQIGVGLTFHVNPWIDIDARIAYVDMITRDATAIDAQGYAISAGISLHP